MAKPIPKGLKDPFFKWGNTTEDLASTSAPLDVAKAQLNDLKVQLAQPGLTRAARALLMKTLAEQKAEVKRLETEAKKALADGVSQKRMQLEIVYKLNALRSQLRRSDLDAEVKTVIATNEKSLAELLVMTSKLTADTIPSLLAKVAATEDALSTLPEFVTDALAKNDSALEKVLAKQDEAREFLRSQKDQLRNFKQSIKEDLINTGVRLADKIGLGPLTLGNLGRALKSTYKGGAYAVKTIKAIRDSRMATPTSELDDNDDSFKDKIVEYITHSRMFQRRMLNKKDKKSESSSLLSSILPNMTSLLGNVGKFFGSGGVIGTLLSTLGGALTGKVLPVLGSLLKGGLRILGPLGALASAFGAGHWVGTQLNKLIEKPLADAVEYFFLKDYKTGKTGFDGTLDTAKTAVSEKWTATKDYAAGMTAKAANAASSAWSDAKDYSSKVYSIGSQVANSAVTSTASTAAAVVDSVSNSSAGQLVSRGIDAAASGLSGVKDWVGKLFTTGSNVDVDGLHPSMQKNMIAMAREYHDKTGKRLQINSGKRSAEKQAYLYKTLPKGKAAPPGRSLHELGLAFDTQSAQGNELSKLGLLSKYGFDRPIKSEPWHVQPKGLTYAAAKQGIYSADGPINQGALSTPVDTKVTPTEGKTPVMSNQSTGDVVSQGRSTRAAQPSSRLGVNDIPMYDMSDGQLLAMNLGVLT